MVSGIISNYSVALAYGAADIGKNVLEAWRRIVIYDH